MVNFLIRTLIRVLISRMLNTTSLDMILDMVNQAEVTEENHMAKRGYVYRSIKSTEPGTTPQHILNAAVELGVYAYKQLK